MDNQELELLQEIAAGIRELKGRMSNMETKQTNMESDIKDVKSRQKHIEDSDSFTSLGLDNINNNIKDVKLRLTTVENEIEDVKREVLKTNIYIENDLWTVIQLIKEGYDGQRDILHDIKNTIDEMSPTVLALDIMHLDEAKKINDF